MVMLAGLTNLVVIDEVQHAAERFFRVLRVLIDRDNRPGQYLLLGSASPNLLRQTSESLLGRVGVEFKRADAPRLTPSMTIAMETLQLDAAYVVYPGLHRYVLAPNVEAVPLAAFFKADGV